MSVREKGKPSLRTLTVKWHRLQRELTELHEEERDLHVRQNVRAQDVADQRDPFALALGHTTAVQIGDTVYVNDGSGSIISRTLKVVD
jgi:hypothetical protein